MQFGERAYYNEFVIVGTLAKLHQLNPTNLTEKLLAIGISPIAGPNIDESLVAVFRRDDVAEVDFTSLQKLSSYETKTGRKRVTTAIDAPTLRQRNLIILVEAQGSASRFSEHAGISCSYLSMLITGKKPFGDRATRSLEIKLGLPTGALDAADFDPSI